MPARAIPAIVSTDTPATGRATRLQRHGTLCEKIKMRSLPVERVGLLAVFLFIALGLSLNKVLERWDLLLYDSALSLVSASSPDDIILVGIDNYSLETLGRWPWPRRVHARLVDRLSEAGSRAVALDIAFSEPDQSDPVGDRLLAEALRRNGRVVLPVFPIRDAADSQMRANLPLDDFRASATLGHVDAELDKDGLARTVYLEAGIGSDVWPHLGLALLQVDGSIAAARLAGERAIRAAMEPETLGWKRDHRVMIPFAGAPGRFERMSYARILEGRNLDRLRGKFVFVGVTAAGLGGELATPVSGHAAPMAGVEFDANVFENLRNGQMIEPLPVGAATLLTVLLVLAPACFYARSTPRGALLAVFLFMLAIAALSIILARVFQLWYPPAAALVALAVSYPLWSWRRLESVARTLLFERERNSATLRAIGDGVIVTDTNGVIGYMNPVAESLTGYRLGQARGCHVDKILNLRDGCGATCLVSSKLNSLVGEDINLEGGVLFLKNGGRSHAIRVTSSVLRDKRERKTGYVLAISNVTELLAMADKLHHQATHDELTELPNRRLLLDRIEHAIASANREHESVAIIFLDLDDFKKINDTLGHASGDQVLRVVAARLRSVVRETDTVARWGGDEFVIVATRLSDRHTIKEVATKILNVLAPPFSLADQEVDIAASIGISLYPDDGNSVDALLKKADIAMYRVKEHQRGSFGIYSYDMNVWTVERFAFEKRLREASEHGEFELHYQPQLDLSTSRIRGAEALLRWQQKDGQWISPGYFIPIAEESGLIQKIGEWVIRTSFMQTKAWQESSLEPLSISVNLSVRQLMHHDFHDFVADALSETRLDPAWIRFEITETTLMRDFEGCREKLEGLKALGFSLSIDDFGTGYASLSYLRRFPVDEVKIDGSFVQNIISQQDDAAIVQAVIALARGMHMSVVAEGVENSAQLAFLEKNHCDTAQGYLISRPVCAAELARFVRENCGRYAHSL